MANHEVPQDPPKISEVRTCPNCCHKGEEFEVWDNDCSLKLCPDWEGVDGREMGFAYFQCPYCFTTLYVEVDQISIIRMVGNGATVEPIEPPDSYEELFPEVLALHEELEADTDGANRDRDLGIEVPEDRKSA